MIPLKLESRVIKVLDPSLPSKQVAWLGANEATFKLLVCVESIRDLSIYIASLPLGSKEMVSTRVLKPVALAAATLAQNVRGLINELEGNARAYKQLTKEHRAQVQQIKSKLEEEVGGKSGSLKRLRDRLVAHIEIDSVVKQSDIWATLYSPLLATWIADCLNALFSLTLMPTYGWWRDDPDDDRPHLMSADSTVLTFADWEMAEIVEVTSARSPLLTIHEEMDKVGGMLLPLKAWLETITEVQNEAWPG